jgi:hypothetical protein
MAGREPCGAEDRDTGPGDIAEEFESAQKLKGNAHRAFEIGAAVALP